MSRGIKVWTQFWASLGAWVLFIYLFLPHGFSPATLISNIHKHVRLIFSHYLWLRHWLKVWMESLGDAQWLSTGPQWLVRCRGHWCAGSLCKAKLTNRKHCPFIGLICENWWICSSSDSVDPFTLHFDVCVFVCVRVVSHEKNLPVKSIHTLFLPQSLVLWTTKHCSEPSQLIATRHGAGGLCCWVAFHYGSFFELFASEHCELRPTYCLWKIRKVFTRVCSCQQMVYKFITILQRSNGLRI